MSPRAACRACGAPVFWAVAPSGARLMLNTARDDTGTSLYAVTRNTDLQLQVRVLQPGEQPTRAEHRHHAHNDTCTERPKAAPGG